MNYLENILSASTQIRMGPRITNSSFPTSGCSQCRGLHAVVNCIDIVLGERLARKCVSSLLRSALFPRPRTNFFSRRDREVHLVHALAGDLSPHLQSTQFVVLDPPPPLASVLERENANDAPHGETPRPDRIANARHASRYPCALVSTLFPARYMKGAPQ